ncbi:MAG: hypothetical protein AVDCRST_MAG03-2631 [uncultured Rubrobacteraceae bacterium]|uniref:Uncharacterized protein n=1 Tax=uncultured Rubrobacteraceae bacterium TaxID=349277 RepID=A0A6J4PPZ0_9ACTN|nr:MAG: hypothetical protein AVDCRST_MAG03-2631 [uncultured Rubrobacteraceae bacterium]
MVSSAGRDVVSSTPALPVTSVARAGASPPPEDPREDSPCGPQEQRTKTNRTMKSLFTPAVPRLPHP